MVTDGTSRDPWPKDQGTAPYYVQPERGESVPQRVTERAPERVSTDTTTQQFGTRLQELEQLAQRIRAGDTALRQILDRGAAHRTGVLTRLERLEQRMDDLFGMLEHLIGAKVDVESKATGSDSTSTPNPKAAASESVRRIRGIGPKHEQALRAIGVVSVAHVVAWTEDDLVRVSAQLGVSEARLRRWREAGQSAHAIE